MASLRVWVFGDIWCKIIGSLTICLNLASVLSILLIAIDRNCAVNSPLHYNVTITKKRTGLLISTIWIVSAALAVPTLFGVPQLEYSSCELMSWNIVRITSIVYITVISALGFAIPFFSVTCLYFAMFRAAETNNARARRNSSNSCLSNDVVVNLKPPKKLGVNEYSLRRNFSSEHADPKGGCCCCGGKHKAAVTGLLVVVSFVLCWSPYFLTLVYQQFKEVTIEIKFWVHFATYISCILNPYVYFYRNKNSWKQSKKLVSRIFSRNSDLIAHPTVRKHKIDTSSCVFRLPTSFSQTVLGTQASIGSTFSNNSIPEDKAHRHTVLSEQPPPRCNKAGVFSLDPIKPLLHQDSSSSNDSSDACVTTVMMGSTMSIDDDSTMWYQAFHQRLSEDSMTEIHLDEDATV